MDERDVEPGVAYIYIYIYIYILSKRLDRQHISQIYGSIGDTGRFGYNMVYPIRFRDIYGRVHL